MLVNTVARCATEPQFQQGRHPPAWNCKKSVTKGMLMRVIDHRTTGPRIGSVLFLGDARLVAAVGCVWSGSD